MARYVIKFTKHGYIKYTSHLDMLRLFKRAFKRTDINLEYSHGFNPHPKMGFAQPLSLGYESLCEMIEFETKTPFDTVELAKRIKSIMPEGIDILGCETLPEEGKSLAALTVEASHDILLPCTDQENDFNRDWEKVVSEFLGQNEIIVMKPQKKTKKEAPLNIRNMIRDAKAQLQGDKLVINLKADCGSNSNLSPELFLKAFLRFTGLQIERNEIDIVRTEIVFGN